MSTPQSILHDIGYDIEQLRKLLDGDENNADIMSRLNNIELQVGSVAINQMHLENLMKVLIKLLSKDEEETKD